MILKSALRDTLVRVTLEFSLPNAQFSMTHQSVFLKGSFRKTRWQPKSPPVQFE